MSITTGPKPVVVGSGGAQAFKPGAGPSAIQGVPTTFNGGTALGGGGAPNGNDSPDAFGSGGGGNGAGGQSPPQPANGGGV